MTILRGGFVIKVFFALNAQTSYSLYSRICFDFKMRWNIAHNPMLRIGWIIMCNNAIYQFFKQKIT